MVPAVAGTVLGALVAARLQGPVLQLGIGILVIVALTVSLAVTRTEHVATGRTPAIVAGATSGFMNAAAGVGGPALSVYAVATRWPQAGFAATAQPYFVVIGLSSLIGKLAASGWALPEVDPGVWPVSIVALLVGLALGELLHARIGHRAARGGVIVIAYLGGVVAVVDGALNLAG